MMYVVYIMNRKQIYVTPDQETKLKELAEREETTVSALIRDALDKFLLEQLTPDIPIEEHPIWSIVGIIDDDKAPIDGSANYKRDLYGRKR
jgi:hypothetical protein